MATEDRVYPRADYNVDPENHWVVDENGLNTGPFSRSMFFCGGGGDVGNKHVVLQHMQPELRSEQLSRRLVRSEPIRLGLQSETMG